MNLFKALGIVLVFLQIYYLSCFGLPDLIRIGALIDTEDDEQKFAIQEAVDLINADPEVLPTSRLFVQVEKILPDSPFEANKKLCEILQMGVAAVFGPQSESSSLHVQSACDALEVPHVLTRWEAHLSRDSLAVNLYPHADALKKAFFQLLEAWGWKDFYIVYEENEGIVRMKDFIQGIETRNWTIRLYQFPNTNSYRDVFWDVKNSLDKRKLRDSEVYYNIVLDVPQVNLFEVLKSAQQVGMMTEKQRYIVTSLDLHSIDLEDFKYSKTNITGLRLVNEENPEFQTLLERVNMRIARRRNRAPVKTLRTESALMYDAVKLFAYALEEMDTGKVLAAFPPVSCSRMSEGTDGTSLVNYMKNLNIQTEKSKSGITGQINFDAEGFRSIIMLDIMYLTEEGLQKIGTIIPDKNINFTRKLAVETEFSELENRCYTITTYLNDPYVMMKDSSSLLIGNERYEGYGIDLLEELRKLLHFTYIIQEVEDNRYGKEQPDGTWDGMIGEVQKGKADMALADLTITSKRERAVDFTLPFLNTGISILFKKPTTKVTSLFSFLSPFSGEVWILVMGAYTAVSVILFVVGRLSPYEWADPHPCRQEDKVQENAFSLLNSMWFTIGSLMQQGSDVAPSASSTRTIASIWYFFNLIMISSYTANLAAFLTVEKVVYPIENAEDLSKQEKIKYGCFKGGSTQQFFESSSIETYERMWKFMKANQYDVLMNDSKLAKARVHEGNFAYLTEASSIEYTIERECNLTMIGGLLDNKGYGIAVKKGNRKLAAWLSGGILQLQEQGFLHTFKERWWKQKKGGGKCTEASKSSSSVNELGLGNVGGIFVVMLLGLSLSAFFAVLEFFWYSRKFQEDSDEPLFKQLIKELKLAVSCGSSVKPVPKRSKKKSRSPASPEYSNSAY